jgi:hypothetical protein
MSPIDFILTPQSLCQGSLLHLTLGCCLRPLLLLFLVLEVKFSQSKSHVAVFYSLHGNPFTPMTLSASVTKLCSLRTYLSRVYCVGCSGSSPPKALQWLSRQISQIFPHLIALLLFLSYIFWIQREPWHGIKHGIDPFLKGWNILQGLSIAACLYCGDLKLKLGVQARDRLWGGGSPAGPGAVSSARGIWD